MNSTQNEILDSVWKTSRTHLMDATGLMQACREGRVPSAVPYGDSFRIRRQMFVETGMLPAKKKQPKAKLKAVWLTR